MGKYKQLTLEERCAIACLQRDGHSLRQIASTLGRSPSTVVRELKRNMDSAKDYDPAHAWRLSQSRCWRGSRLARQPALRSLVLERLAMGYSPEQVAGRLAREHGRPVISHESIYRFIDTQIRRTKQYDWRYYLPQAKAKRGYRKRKNRNCANWLPGRTSIHARPQHIATRQQSGHWEADLMSFAQAGKAIVIACERTSRLLMTASRPAKTAELVIQALQDMLAPLPEHLRRSMTFDNGTEFAHHQKLRLETFFCDPHSPWQKGSVENAIGRLRRYLPRKTNIHELSEQEITAITQRYNHTPRKCLDYQTPAEVFLNQMLHFDCESTPGLRRVDKSIIYYITN